MLAGNKIIFTAAVNGGMQQDRGGAVIPKTPAEIGEAAARCYEAGATLVHFHARDAEGRNSGDPAIYAEAIKEIRARSPILVQTTNGIGVRRDPATGDLRWPNDQERLGILAIEPSQDLFGIAAGSMDFYNPEGGYRASRAERPLHRSGRYPTPRQHPRHAWSRGADDRCHHAGPAQ